MEFSRQEYWSGLPCPLPGNLWDSGIQPESPASPVLQVDSLPTEPPGKLRFLVTGFNLLTKAIVIYVPKRYMSIIFIDCNVFAWYEDNTGLGASQVGTSCKESTCQCRRHKRHRLQPWVGKIPWRRAWQPTPVFLPLEFHGQRSLAGYNSWGHKEPDRIEWPSMNTGLTK